VDCGAWPKVPTNLAEMIREGVCDESAT
jgi:hypothetical protein